MKLSNRIKPPELVTRTSRLESAFRPLPTQPVADVTRCLPPDGDRSDKTRKRAKKLTIPNLFYHAPAACSVQWVGDFTNRLDSQSTCGKDRREWGGWRSGSSEAHMITVFWRTGAGATIRNTHFLCPVHLAPGMPCGRRFEDLSLGEGIRPGEFRDKLEN